MLPTWTDNFTKDDEITVTLKILQAPRIAAGKNILERADTRELPGNFHSSLRWRQSNLSILARNHSIQSPLHVTSFICGDSTTLQYSNMSTKTWWEITWMDQPSVDFKRMVDTWKYSIFTDTVCCRRLHRRSGGPGQWLRAARKMWVQSQSSRCACILIRNSKTTEWYFVRYTNPWRKVRSHWRKLSLPSEHGSCYYERKSVPRSSISGAR